MTDSNQANGLSPDCHFIRWKSLPYFIIQQKQIEATIEPIMMLEAFFGFKFSWLYGCTSLLSYSTLETYIDGPIDVCSHYRYKCSFLCVVCGHFPRRRTCKKFLSNSLHIAKRFRYDITCLIISFLRKQTGILGTFGIYLLAGLLSIKFGILQVIM